MTEDDVITFAAALGIMIREDACPLCAIPYTTDAGERKFMILGRYETGIDPVDIPAAIVRCMAKIYPDMTPAQRERAMAIAEAEWDFDRKDPASEN